MRFDDDPDPLVPYVAQALSAGWLLVPQAGLGECENALVMAGERVTDLVTLPTLGHSTVVRLQGGGPARDRPRRTGRQLWRHHMPPAAALAWLLTDEQQRLEKPR